MSEHVDNELLVAYTAAMIEDEAELARIEEHLLICEQCRDVVIQTDRKLSDVRPSRAS